MPASGFAPISHFSDVAGVLDRPWLVVAMPICLTAIAAGLAALVWPAPGRVRIPPAISAGGVVLLLGGLVSILDSPDPVASAVIAVVAITAPALLLVALLHARLDPSWMAVGLLVSASVLLLRADTVFLRDWGFPTTAKLFAAKYQNVAYDFHYYTLGNPDHTAGYLLMPLTLASLWVLSTRLRPAARIVIAATGAVAMATLVITYARFATATGVAVLVLAALAAPVARWVRVILVGCIAALAVAFVISAFDYLTELLSTSSDASVPERVSSLKDGLIALADNPFMGVGLGQYTSDHGYFPAHSSIIQAAAEMGVLGLCGLLLLTGGTILHARAVVAADGWLGLRPAAAVAVAVYALHAALAAPSSSGLFSGYVSVWGATRCAAASHFALAASAPTARSRELRRWRRAAARGAIRARPLPALPAERDDLQGPRRPRPRTEYEDEVRFGFERYFGRGRAADRRCARCLISGAGYGGRPSAFRRARCECVCGVEIVRGASRARSPVRG